MKFRLLERNYWGDSDVWKGKKFKYIVEISTPFRETHANYGIHSFSIKTPYGKVHNSYTTDQTFDTLQEAFDYVEHWIIEDNKEQKAQ